MSQVDCKMDIDKKHDTIYKKGEQIPFSGYYKEYYPGSIKMEGKYLNGLRVGKFTYYSYYRSDIDSIVNYKNGKKDGMKKTFTPWRYTDCIEYYTNDTLDGDCYYFVEGGQLDCIITYEKGKKLKIDTCNLNDSIYYIEVDIKGPEGLITKSFFKSKDSLQVILINDNHSESKEERKISILTNYKVISYTYFINGDDVYQSGESPITFEKHKDFLDNTIFKGIEITNILIENPCGQRYYLPSKLFKCEYGTDEK